MIEYNPKLWRRLIFQLHKTDTLRVLFPWMIAIGIYATVVAYIELKLLHNPFKSSSIIFSILGFVLSLLLVFRTNTAYDRWWEGRKQWGALVNCSRNLQLKLTSILASEGKQESLKLAELIGVYAQALKSHLRDRKIETQLIPAEVIHQPNAIASQMFMLIQGLYMRKQLTGDQLITVNQDITSFTDICGACERIKKTPIPYSYSLFVKKFIFIYILTMPVGLSGEFGFMIIPIVMFVFYALASVEILAEEIENPFGTDPNDLPLESLCETIKTSVNEIAGWTNTEFATREILT